jgi:hypothetical protein
LKLLERHGLLLLLILLGVWANALLTVYALTTRAVRRK